MVPRGEHSLKFDEFDVLIRGTSVVKQGGALFAKMAGSGSCSASYSRLDERLTAFRLSLMSKTEVVLPSRTSLAVTVTALRLSLPPLIYIVFSNSWSSLPGVKSLSLPLRLVTDVIFSKSLGFFDMISVAFMFV